MPTAAPYFLPYQERWINDDSTLKIAEKSRRVGFTYASSYRMFRKCMKRGKGFTQWVSSRDQLTAQELIRDYISRWCKLANVVAKGMYGEDVVVVDPAKNITAFQCVFPTGARIISLSSTPEAFAGKGGDVFLDEADLHQDSAKLFDMAMHCIMWGNQLEVVSAYRVDGTKDTPFARMVAAAKADNPQGASLHRVSIYDAVDQGLVEKINGTDASSMVPASLLAGRDAFLKKMRSLARTQAAWESQFECKVQDAGGKLLSIASLAKCEMDGDAIALIEQTYPNALRFAGFDVARRSHASAWHEYILVGQSLYLVNREILRGRDFEEQEKFIKAKMQRREKRIARLAIDATGLGMQLAENMAKAFPGRVDQVNLESHRRHELCMLYKDRVDHTRVFLPADDQLREDFNSPFTKSSANGSMRVVVPAFESQDGEMTHCDEFMASVLANSAADAGAVPSSPIVAHRSHAPRTISSSYSRRCL